MNDSRVFDAAQSILENIEGIFAQYGVDLPEKRYITIGGQGDTAHDCDQVTVSWEQSYNGTPGNQSQTPSKCENVRTGVFVVELVRATAVGRGLTNKPTAPSASDYTEKAKQQMLDATILYEAGLTAAETTWLSGGLVDISAGTPQGERQAIIMTVTMVV